MSQAIDGLSAEERSALIALCMEYCWRCDNYKSASVPELFTEDGIYESNGYLMNGMAELVKDWNKRDVLGAPILRRHMISNYRFWRGSNGLIHGQIVFTLYKEAIEANVLPKPSLVAEHLDTYQKCADGIWRFKTRKVVPLYPRTWQSDSPLKAESRKSA
jgi:hypothetical protein